jgi:hypothetical protein
MGFIFFLRLLPAVVWCKFLLKKTLILLQNNSMKYIVTKYKINLSTSRIMRVFSCCFRKNTADKNIASTQFRMFVLINNPILQYIVVFIHHLLPASNFFVIVLL